MSAAPIVLDHDWADDEDRPFGGWVQVDFDEYRAIVGAAGGLIALDVFSTLTDPDGDYGSAQIYTAWGRPGERHPLVDVRDFYADGRDAGVTETRLRKFVLAPESERGER